MLKRVLAWIILIGFVLLLLNIAIFKFYWQASLAVYVVIVIFFVLANGKIIPMQNDGGYVRPNDDNNSGDHGSDTDTGNNGTDGADKAEAEDGKEDKT